jgi:hypothetical protein
VLSEDLPYARNHDHVDADGHFHTSIVRAESDGRN